MKRIQQNITQTVCINEKPETVFDFLSTVENWPKWCLFFKSVKQSGDFWLVDNPTGHVAKAAFTSNPENMLLQLALDWGTGFESPEIMLVAPNGTGCLVILNVFAPTGAPPELIEDIKAWTKADLRTLRSMLDKP